jgi:hypothetical protein
MKEEEMMEYSVIGKRIERVDGSGKVTTRPYILMI